MTYTEAYAVAKSGKRVRLVLPARLRGETHQFVMHPISTGDVMMHIHIEHEFAATIFLSLIAIDHPNPISTCSNFIGIDDLNKWEVVE